MQTLFSREPMANAAPALAKGSRLNRVKLPFTPPCAPIPAQPDCMCPRRTTDLPKAPIPFRHDQSTHRTLLVDGTSMPETLIPRSRQHNLSGNDSFPNALGRYHPFARIDSDHPRMPADAFE